MEKTTTIESSFARLGTMVSGRLHIFVMRFKAWRHRRKWEYGNLSNGKFARRNKSKGNVQFILWMPREQGHEKPLWYNTDSSWWPSFKSKA